MTREEMVKIRWRPYMEIEYKHSRMPEPIRCMLISINFDDEVLELQPFDFNYYQQSFFSAIQNCSISKNLKAVVIDGKKVKENVLLTSNKRQPNFDNINPAS